jgi:hypothetical protein
MPEEILGRKSYSISDYLDIPNEPQPYIVNKMIYEYGKTVLVGKPKMGKSHLAVKMGLSVALGQPVLGLNVKQCPVLLLGYSGTSYSPHYSRDDRWDKETIVKVFSYVFAPFAGALTTVNIGSYIFESAWSASGILRWFFILLGEVAAVLIVYLIKKHHSPNP